MRWDDIEVWRPYLDEPIEVSQYGKVRSLAQDKRRPLKPVPNTTAKHWYWQVGWMSNGKRKIATVHKLVLTAFWGPRPPGLIARHLNGDRLDNRACNLQWGTHQENADDRRRHIGEARKLCAGQVVEIRTRYQLGESTRELGKVFGVSPVTIVHICNGQTWKWLPMPPRLRAKQERPDPSRYRFRRVRPPRKPRRPKASAKAVTPVTRLTKEEIRKVLRERWGLRAGQASQFTGDPGGV
jgi:hypothetical protein